MCLVSKQRNVLLFSELPPLLTTIFNQIPQVLLLAYADFKLIMKSDSVTVTSGEFPPTQIHAHREVTSLMSN